VIDALDNELIKGDLKAGDTVTVDAESADAAELSFVRADRTTSLLLVKPEELDSLADLATASGTIVPGGTTLPLRMDDLDEVTAHQFSHRRTRVNKEEALRAPAPKKAAEIKPEGRVFQPFCLTLVLADEAALTAMRAKLAELAPKYNFEKLHEEIDPVTVKTSSGETKAIQLKTHVSGLIEYMLELSKVLPLMKIKVEELEIKA